MRHLKRIGWGLCWFLLAGLAVLAQIPATPAGSTPPAVREIYDPHSGVRWRLVKDAAHPGGPGRLVPVAAGEHAVSGGTAIATSEVHAPVIRAGDLIVVEEHTEVVDAALEAVALGPAAEHGTLHARLRIGGRVVQATTVAPGRAQLAAREVRP
jgi:hypothetical protein